MKLASIVITGVCAVLIGCAMEPPPSLETAKRAKKVTFYGDILPLLQANANGEHYKCVTCHAHYADPKSLTNVRESERVIESMVSGRMPRGGTPVPEEKIELFRIWQNQGFPIGDE